MMLIHTTTFRVRFNEADSLGIVWHGHYIAYFEDGREAFGEHFGISYRDIVDAGLHTPVVRCVCDYKHPLRFGEQATIETTFINDPAARLIFRYHIRNLQQRTVATGETIQVFTDNGGELQLGNPPFFEAWKQKHKLL